MFTTMGREVGKRRKKVTWCLVTINKFDFLILLGQERCLQIPDFLLHPNYMAENGN
jgi:hypothetical protein